MSVHDDPPRGAMIAAAQARRDRARLAASLDEAVALRRRVAELEHSPSRKLLAPARHVAHAITRRLRRPELPAAATPRPDRGVALLIDDNWPQPDRDSGSIDIVNLALALRRLGFSVLLAAAHQHDGPQPARERVEALGIPCLRPTQASSVGAFLAEQGGTIDLAVLCRAFSGGAFLDQVRRQCGRARLIFQAVDINWVREERRARLLGDAGLLGRIDELRAIEERVIRECDATVVVSEAEIRLLAETVPDCLTVLLPLARDVQAPVRGFGERHGIGFLGGFAHAPNEDAVRTFLADCWPMVLEALPDCTFTIVGSDAPTDLAQGAHGVRGLGHVPDLGPWFETLCATVAPLRYGAGAKGKVASSLAAGVPCVASPVAAEGMSLGEADGVLVASDPAAFAAAIVRVCTDETGWGQLSAGAQAYATRHLSIDLWQPRLDFALRRIGF